MKPEATPPPAAAPAAPTPVPAPVQAAPVPPPAAAPAVPTPLPAPVPVAPVVPPAQGVPPDAKASGLPATNLALGKRVLAKSSRLKDGAAGPEAAVDGNIKTRWSSEFWDPQWFAVDIGSVTKISRVEFVWDKSYPKNYSIQVSRKDVPGDDDWTVIHTTEHCKGGTESIDFPPVEARWIRYFGREPSIKKRGQSLKEFRVFP